MRRTAQISSMILLAIFMTCLTVTAQDGATLYVHKFCTTCHGHDGISIAPNYPNLARQNEQYLVNQVKDIQAKKRTNKLTPLMTEHPVVMSITDEEISAIAAHMNKIEK